MKMLLVEDDEKLSFIMKNCLMDAGYAVDESRNGAEALSMASAKPYEFIMLDLMIPEVPGMEVISKMRKAGLVAPILVVSAKTSVEEKVQALKSGADDYITKPFSFAELLVRVEALLRRTNAQAAPTKLSLGGLQIDFLTREVTRDNKNIDLQAKEFELLAHFFKNHDKIISKTDILQNIWGYDFDPQTNVVDVLVCRLRNKIDKGFKNKMIQTRRGIGYFFKTHE